MCQQDLSWEKLWAGRLLHERRARLSGLPTGELESQDRCGDRQRPPLVHLESLSITFPQIERDEAAIAPKT